MNYISLLYNNVTNMPEVNDDFTILWILISGILVFFMQAGFTLLESGMTQSKNAVNIAMKNFMDISVATITFWVIGYGLMYGAKTAGFISLGSDVFFNPGAGAHDVFFQLVFAATAATIVSGAIAGRTKYSVFAIFAVIITGLIYPIAGGWEWNPDGWLNSASFMPVQFIDLAGSSIVHAVGGWAALVGAYMVGPRIGKYVKGKVEAIPGHNKTLATLGVMVLWFGWFGFNGGSQLALAGFENATAVATIYINTNLAACAGVMTCAVITRLVNGKTDVIMMLNGALGGLVAITAEPLTPTPLMAIIIGAIGGIIVILGTQALNKLQIDDVVGAIPVHLFAGIWGTLAVPLTNSGTSFGPQLLGTASICAFVFVVSFIVWSIMKATIGIRISEEAEKEGTDIAETGVTAYAIRD